MTSTALSPLVRVQLAVLLRVVLHRAAEAALAGVLLGGVPLAVALLAAIGTWVTIVHLHAAGARACNE